MAKSRGGRVTSAQHEILLDYMESHQEFLNGKFSDSFTKIKSEQMWEELSMNLNNDGNGPIKDVDKWKKTWQDWKSAVKAKAARIRVSIGATGGGKKTKEILTDLEQRLLNIIGKIVVEGNLSIPLPCGSLPGVIQQYASTKEGNSSCNTKVNSKHDLEKSQNKNSTLTITSFDNMDYEILDGFENGKDGLVDKRSTSSRKDSSLNKVTNPEETPKRKSWKDLDLYNTPAEEERPFEKNLKKVKKNGEFELAAKTMLNMDEERNKIKITTCSAFEAQARATEHLAKAAEAIANAEIRKADALEAIAKAQVMMADAEKEKAIAAKQHAIAATGTTHLVANFLQIMQPFAKKVLTPAKDAK